MTQEVQQLLSAFDSLSDSDKHIAAMEVLRRSLPDRSSELSDEALIAAAEGLFAELDAREAADAER